MKIAVCALLGLVSVTQAYKEGPYVVRETAYGTVMVEMEGKPELGWTDDDDYELVQRRAE